MSENSLCSLLEANDACQLSEIATNVEIRLIKGQSVIIIICCMCMRGVVSAHLAELFL